MHTSSYLRMQWFVETYAAQAAGDKLKVLDVGSYDVNGSYRELFPAPRYQYVGLDMADGPNVDLVLENPYDWRSVASDQFDLVISGQAFEHIEFFWKTLEEMVRVTKQGGLLCIIAPNGFYEHRFPVDCYRFFTDGMVALARYTGIETLHAHTNCAPSSEDHDWHLDNGEDALLVAKKHYSGPPTFDHLLVYRCAPPDHAVLRGALVPINKSPPCP